MRIRTVAAALAAASGTLVSAQTITTQRIDGETEHGRTELILRASPTTRDVIAAWMHWDDIDNGIIHVHYNVSTDGETFRSDPGHIPIPNPASGTLRGADPMIAFDYNGVGWVGRLAPVVSPRFYVARKGVGEPYADEAEIVQFEDTWDAVDKGVLVAGPPQGQPMGSPLTGLLFGYYRAGACQEGGYRLHSMVNPPPENSPAVLNQDFYSVISQCGDHGAPNDGVVLRNAEGNVGRWVVAYYSRSGSPCGTPAAYSPRSRARISEDGVNWTESVDPTMATVPCDQPCAKAQEDIQWFDACNHAALLPVGGPAVTNFPAIAADPRDENTVYMVFLGRSASVDSGQNIDLFIARSVDGGENFSGNEGDPFFEEPGDRVLHIRDEDLNDPAGSVQFLPSITVDTWGAVHVLYYVGIPPISDEPWRYQVKMVTIENFSVFPHPDFATLRLFPEEPSEYFTLDHSLVPLEGGGRRTVGHYNLGISSRWCEVYAGYIAREADSSDGPAAYVTRIVLDQGKCVTPVDCYANCDESTQPPVLNVADFTCFLQRFAQGCGNPTPCYANCDGSTQVPFLNVADFTCFLQQFGGGCQ